MTRRRKHAIAVLLVFAMALGLGLNPTSYKEAQAAKKTVRLSKKSLVLTVGKMGTLQMLYTKKKVAWSVKSGKDVVKLSNKKKTK